MNARRRPLLLVPVIAGLVFPVAGAAQGRSIFSALDTQGRTVALGTDGSGTLADSDVLSAGGRRVQVWTLGTDLGTQVQVDLRSDDFDPFLYVVGPGLDEGLRDDDGGSGLNARVCFVPDQPGEYRIVAASLSAGTGAFTLSAVAAPAGCGGAVETSEIDDLTAFPTGGRVVAVGDDVAGSLGTADATFYGSPAQAWAVQGTAGQPFSIDLVSEEFDAFLTVMGPGLTEYFTDDDGAGRCDSRVSLTFPETGEYRVIVSTLGAGSGAFRLVASERPGPTNPAPCVPPSGADGPSGGSTFVEGSLDEISIVGSLRLESAVSGELSGNEASYRERPLQGWSLQGTAGDRVALTLVSDQFDTYLFFDGPGFSEPLSDDDSAGDLDSRLCVELPETGSYRVFAGPLASADAGASYRLEATVRGAEDLCSGDFVLSPDAMAAALAGLDTGGRSIGVNEERSGSLSGATTHPESDRPVEAWTLRGAPGTFVYVDVVSSMFDAYLYVVGEGMETLTGDDFGDSRNTRLEFTLPAGGEVTLLPSAFNATARGDYLLRVATNPGPLEPTAAGGAGGGGSLVDSGALLGLGLPVGELPFGAEVQGVLGEGDDVLARGFAQGFTFEGSAGQEVVFELVSDDFDCYLYVSGPGLDGVLADDDSAGNLDSRIEATLREAGSYTVVVSALSADTGGAFRLRAFRVVR